MTKRDYSYGVIPAIKTANGFEYLLIHQALGHWTFPKGHKNEWESDLEAAKRELWEESGVTEIDIIPNVEFKVHYELPGNEQGFTDKEVKFFLGIAKEKVANVPEDFSHEILDAKWCTVAEADALFSKPEWKSALSDADAYLTTHF